MQYIFGAVLATLEEIANGENRSRAVEATRIWTQVQTLQFLVSLISFWQILSITWPTQQTLFLLQKAPRKISGVMYSGITYAKDVAKLHGIKVESPRPCCHQQLPRSVQDGVVVESTGVRAVVSPSLSNHYKRTLYFPVLDAMLTQLERKFSNKTFMHIRAVQACAPRSPTYLDPNQLDPLPDS